MSVVPRLVHREILDLEAVQDDAETARMVGVWMRRYDQVDDVRLVVVLNVIDEFRASVLGAAVDDDDRLRRSRIEEIPEPKGDGVTASVAFANR